MIKKGMWIYTALISAAILALIGYQIYKDLQIGDFQAITYIFILALFLPPAVLAWGLKGKKGSILLILLSLLLTAVPVIGIFNFNNLDLATIGKAALFLPMIVGLIYYGIKSLSKK